MSRVISSILAFFMLVVSGLSAMTIEDKLASLGEAPAPSSNPQKNLKTTPEKDKKSISELKKELNVRYAEVNGLLEKKADQEEYEALLEKVNDLRDKIKKAEERARKGQVKEVQKESDAAGLWSQDEITVSQLIVEYGASEYLYVIPPEVASIKVHIHSSLMIQRDAWIPLLEGILKYNGVGIKEINTYSKQLFLLKQDFVSVECITSETYQLDLLDPKTRVAHLFATPVEQSKSVFYFLERIRDPKTTLVYQAGPKIAMIGFQEDIKRLVNLCENIWESKYPKVTKVVSLSKIQPEEGIKILKTFFNGLSDPTKSMMPSKGGHDLSALPLSKESSIILIGAQDVVSRAESILLETEHQVDDPNELTVYWYTCSHSNPTDLAEILDKVYGMLIFSSIEGEARKGGADAGGEGSYPHEMLPPPNQSGNPDALQPPYVNATENPSYWNLAAQRDKARSEQESANEKNKKMNFIPYPTTGAILMVVRKDTLPKIKEIIKKLDIPKRMVEIEVLLCERMLNNSTRSGLNLLQLGTHASSQKEGGVTYGRTDETLTKGLFEFFFSRASSKAFPAFDVIYNFLLSQEDVRVTTSPSALTINQTPVTLTVTDQISINNGASPVQTNDGWVFKDSYDRADYGMVITITPTIHEPEIDDPTGQIFVTLDNDISFETIRRQIGQRDRPDVHKRQVKNQVRIADGQTVILGGLRSKTAEDKNEKIPFLGEIPGLGKLFGTTVLNERADDMFIFIKPRVVHDPKNDLMRITLDRLRNRPGDIQHFMECIKDARDRTKTRLFQQSLNLFRTPKDDTVCL